MSTDRTGEFIPDHPTTIGELIAWLRALEGTEIRGRKVIESNLDLAADGSARVVLTVGRGADIIDRINGPGDTDEFVWHVADLRTILLIEPRWEYWDEFADRDMRGDE